MTITLYLPPLFFSSIDHRAPRKVSLLEWRKRNGRATTAFLNRSSIASAAAIPGQAVRTAWGLGNVQLVREDGVVVVATTSLRASASLGAASASAIEGER